MMYERGKTLESNTHTLCYRARAHITNVFTQLDILDASQFGSGYSCKVFGDQIERIVNTVNHSYMQLWRMAGDRATLSSWHWEFGQDIWKSHTVGERHFKVFHI